MSKKEKLKRRLASGPKDFTYQELIALLTSMGYMEDQKGKTSGLRVCFINETSKHIISLHKPPPSKILKRYQIVQLIDELTKIGLL